MNKSKLSNKGYKQEHYFKEDTIYLSDIMMTIARQIRVILIIPSILCFITLVYLFLFVKPTFISTAKIMSSSNSGESKAAGLAAQFGVNIFSDQSNKQWVYPEIIKSRTLARSMLKRKFDTNEFGPQKSLLQILTYGNNKPEVGMDTLIIDGVNASIDMIEIRQNGSFYDLTISASEPVFARDFTIALLEELDSHQRDYNKAKTSKAKQFIEERISDIEKELNTAEEKLKDFAKSNRRIENSPLLKLEQARLDREVMVLIGVFTTLKQQLETTKIEEVKDSEYVIVLDPPEAPMQRSKPNKRLILVLSGILGIGMGILFAFIKENFAKSDKKEKNKIGEALSLLIKNILGLLPPILRKNN